MDVDFVQAIGQFAGVGTVPVSAEAGARAKGNDVEVKSIRRVEDGFAGELELRMEELHGLCVVFRFSCVGGFHGTKVRGRLVRGICLKTGVFIYLKVGRSTQKPVFDLLKNRYLALVDHSQPLCRVSGRVFRVSGCPIGEVRNTNSRR